MRHLPSFSFQANGVKSRALFQLYQNSKKRNIEEAKTCDHSALEIGKSYRSLHLEESLFLLPIPKLPFHQKQLLSQYSHKTVLLRMHRKQLLEGNNSFKQNIGWAGIATLKILLY